MVSFVAKYPNAPLSTLFRLAEMDITLSDYQEVVNPFGWGIYEKNHKENKPQVPQPSVLMKLYGISGECTILQEQGLGYDHWMRADHGEVRVFGYSKETVEKWLEDPWTVVLSQSVYEMGHETLRDFDKDMKVTDLIALFEKTIIFNNELRSFANSLLSKLEEALRMMHTYDIVIRWYNEIEEGLPTAHEDKPFNVWCEMETYRYLDGEHNCNWDSFSIDYLCECLIEDMNSNENRTHAFYNAIREYLEDNK